MINFKQFIKEGLLDDITSSLETNTEFKTPNISKIAAPRRRFKPRVYNGIKPKSFFEYLYSEQELKSEIKDKLNTSYSLQAVIDLFTKENMGVRDDITLTFSTDQINKIKEYSRTTRNGWTGKLTSDEMISLKSDIKKNGIRDYGVIDMYRLKNGKVSVILGEGNHRLQIANDLGIKEMKMKIYYQK